MQTTAAVLRETGAPLSIEEVTLAAPGPREVLVRMVASGVCHSDLHIVDGSIPANLPIICGHEGAGVVVETGPGVTGVEEGDHVVLAWVAACGRCSYCAAGRPNLCATTIGPSYAGHLWDGTSRFTGAGGEQISHHLMVSSFAGHAVVPDGGVVPVPRDLPLERLALLGCAVATGVGAVTNTVPVEIGSTVAVVGLGGVGLNAVQGARLRGAAAIIGVDIVPSKLELARRFGATDVVDGREDAVARILELTGGRGVDVAVEAVGAPGTVEVALASLARGGTAVVIGLAAPGTHASVDLYHLIDERRLAGTYYGSTRPMVDIPRLAELYRRGLLLVDELISDELPLARVDDALDGLRQGKVIRTILRH